MSDVERWIEQWHSRLAGSELLAGSDVNEMENHLREEMEDLRRSGLSEEEAFLVARRRLGDTAALEQEFAKVNRHRLLTNRLWWMVAGVLAYLVATHFATVVSQVSLTITRGTGLSPHVLGLVTLAVQVGAFCVVGALVLWLCARYSRPGVRPHTRISRRLRLAFLVGLLAETLALVVMRMFAVPRAITTMTPQAYGQVLMVQSIGHFAWMLVGPVLLAALLMTMHLGSRQKTETQ
jgi:hypothetical protein